MNLADLLSGLPRDLFETILAVFFGTYLSKQVFRTALPAGPRPTFLALPRAPASSPATLLLDPPSVIPGIPTTLATRNNTSSLLCILSSERVFEDGRVPAQDVETVVYSIAVLVFYLAVLVAITNYASHRPPARPDPSLRTISQLYEFLTGRPYASTHWERVLDSPNPSLNWYFSSPDIILNLDASLDPELPCTPASDTLPEYLPDECECPRYTASLDADRLDAFAAYLLRLGYTDLRIQADDITPTYQATSSSAVTVDFRFTARSAVRELVTRTIMRFVLPSDVPMDRTDFMMWDLGDGWVRAFEIGSFEMAVLPVDEDEERRERGRDNLDHLSCLPFHFGDDETDENLDRLMCMPFYLSDGAGEGLEDVHESMAVVVAPERTSVADVARFDRLFAMLFCGRSTTSSDSAMFVGPHTARQTRMDSVALKNIDTVTDHSDTSAWLLDSFSSGKNSLKRTPKLVTAPSMSDSFVDVSDDTLPEMNYDMEGSWAEQHMSGSRMEESLLVAPSTDDEIHGFVVVPHGDIGELVSSTPVMEPYVPHSPEPADPGADLLTQAIQHSESLAAVAEETELSVCSFPEVEGSHIATLDYLDEPQRAPVAAVEPLGHELPASSAVTEGPSPQMSAPMNASVGTLVDAALNSVIELPVAEHSIDLVHDPATILLSSHAMVFKTPSVYAGQLLAEHGSKASQNLDVEADSPAVFGPALPPVEQV